MEKYTHANGKQKKVEIAILISDKIGLKIKKITRDKEGHYIMIKGSIQEEGIRIVNIYAPKSDNHYIFYCKQESLRRNGVAIMVNKRV